MTLTNCVPPQPGPPPAGGPGFQVRSVKSVDKLPGSPGQTVRQGGGALLRDRRRRLVLIKIQYWMLLYLLQAQVII